MAFVKRRIKFLTLVTAGLLLLSGLAFSFFVSSPRQAAHASGSQGFYQQTNLVSDLAGLAQITDPSLVNAWGLVHGPTTPWWVADNGTGVSTLYNTMSATVVKVPLTVTIPAPAAALPERRQRRPALSSTATVASMFHKTANPFQVCSSLLKNSVAEIVSDTPTSTRVRGCKWGRVLDTLSSARLSIQISFTLLITSLYPQDARRECVATP